MSGIPPADMPLPDLARSVHAGWALDSVKKVYAVRLAEDRQAAARVDAQTRNFDLRLHLGRVPLTLLALALSV